MSGFFGLGLVDCCGAGVQAHRMTGFHQDGYWHRLSQKCLRNELRLNSAVAVQIPGRLLLTPGSDLESQWLKILNQEWATVGCNGLLFWATLLSRCRPLEQLPPPKTYVPSFSCQGWTDCTPSEACAVIADCFMRRCQRYLSSTGPYPL